MSSYRIINADCLDAMAAMDAESVDLVVTSPPYDNLRTYGGTLEWSHEKFCEIADALFRLVKPGGVVVWIVGDATVNGSETGSSFRQALRFMDVGFNLHDTMIWQKDSFNSVGDLQVRYAQVFEYMFVLSKGKPKSFNPIKDRPNKHAGKVMHGTKRKSCGEMISISSEGKVLSDFGVRFNVWQLNADKSHGTNHPAVFPVSLAVDHIRTWSNGNSVVFDPFVGSGSTGVASVKTGRTFIGCDISADYCEIAEARIAHEVSSKESAPPTLF